VFLFDLTCYFHGCLKALLDGGVLRDGMHYWFQISNIGRLKVGRDCGYFVGWIGLGLSGCGSSWVKENGPRGSSVPQISQLAVGRVGSEKMDPEAALCHSSVS